MKIRIESFVEKYWHFLLISAFVIAVCSCTIQPLQLESGEVITTVELAEVVEGVVGTGVADVIENIAGPVIDGAIEHGPKIVEQASDGNYLGLVMTIVGLIGGIFGGYKVRNKLKAKKK
jgi:hypothetical protein